MISLDVEFEAAMNRFERAGHQLPGDACLYTSGVGLEKIEPDGEFYEPGEQGQRTLIVPVFAGSMPCFAHPQDEIPDLIDLVALSPKDTTRWWRRTGLTEYLNEHLIRAAVTWGNALRVHARPWDWLKARCDGVCPLTTDYSALRCAPELICDDPLFAARVRRALAQPFPIPRIRVPARAAA